MKRENQATGAGWNSGVAVGQKWAFTVAETLKLSRNLAEQGNWHDLALLSLGNDSLLRAEDLLSLTVADVYYSTGKMRDTLGKRQGKTGRNVFPPLLNATKTHVAHWIKSSGKRQHHALFTRSKPIDTPPITRRTYSLVVKGWAEWLGQPPEMYSTHSVRRTKPEYIFWEAERQGRGEQVLVLLSEMLGHKSVEVTTRYLGINQKRATELWQRYPMIVEHKFTNKK